MELANKTALVTGASGGIGRAIAIALAQKGMTVLVHYHRNDTGAAETHAEVEKHSRGKIYRANLMEPEQIERMFKEICADYSTIDVLVNCAGDARAGKIFDGRSWDYAYKNILLSAVGVTEQFLALSSQVPRKIINIGSIYGALETANAAHAHYSAMKAALANLTVILAKSLGPRVLVNAVAPGYTRTPAWEGVPKERMQACADTTKIGRFVEAHEIAHAVVFLAENDAMTGQIVTVDGGTSIPADA